MNDRNLLDSAAKAVGHVVARETDDGKALLLAGMQAAWNPLADDGDALRLAVQLKLMIDPGTESITVFSPWDDETKEAYGDDELAATRRAIVRAAAALSETGG